MMLIFLTMNVIRTNLVFRRDTISGCEKTNFLEEAVSFRIIKIEFLEQCIEFEKCAFDLKYNKEDCVEKFKDSMSISCEQRIFLQRYCLRLVSKNIEIVQNFDESKFFYIENVMKVIIAYRGYVFNYDLKLDSSPATNTQALEKLENEDYYFSIQKISDGKFVIRNKNNECLDGDGIFKTCNGDDTQIMNFKVKSFVTGVKNSSGEFLDNTGKFVSSPVEGLIVFDKSGIQDIDCYWFNQGC